MPWQLTPGREPQRGKSQVDERDDTDLAAPEGNNPDRSVEKPASQSTCEAEHQGDKCVIGEQPANNARGDAVRCPIRQPDIEIPAKKVARAHLPRRGVGFCEAIEDSDWHTEDQTGGETETGSPYNGPDGHDDDTDGCPLIRADSTLPVNFT